MAAEVFPSEERTEPFTAEELSRLHKNIQVEDFDEAHHDTVPLDDLVIDEDHHRQGIRILVRPLTRSRSVSPGNDNCQWLALRAEVSDPQQPKTKVLAVTQTSKDINFSIRIPGEHGECETRPPVWCELYYAPTSDSLILWNKSDVPITLARISHPNQGGVNFDQEIVPGNTKELLPGTWRISVSGTPVLDFRILEKRPATLKVACDSPESSSVGSNNVLNSSVKRFLSPSEDEPNGDSGKKPRRENSEEGKKDGVIIFLGPKDESLVFPLPNTAKTKEVAIPNGHALLELQKDETAMIPGGCEIDQYQLTKRDQIASTGASSVFTAEHSHVSDGLITVKVLKTRVTNSDVRPPQENHRNVIRQADIWLREYQSQEDLKHESIVKLYGGDARYLSLYMEHVDGKDLAARGVWRDANDYFRGDRRDAVRILKDIASALNYVHQKKKIHNDIKPANILYSRDRGAVLCDFGLSTRTVDPAYVKPSLRAITNGGTPFYVPPEFIGQKTRGTASDVWALGVAMLYVLRKIAFPDAQGRKDHPKQLYWMIADLNKKPTHHHPSTRGHSAISQMQQWLGVVKDARARLNTRDKLEFLVSQMLVPNPHQRITMAKVMAELFPDGGTVKK